MNVDRVDIAVLKARVDDLEETIKTMAQIYNSSMLKIESWADDISKVVGDHQIQIEILNGTYEV